VRGRNERANVLHLYGGRRAAHGGGSRERLLCVSWRFKLCACVLSIRWGYAQSLYTDPGATLDDLREAVETLDDAERIARRVFGGKHPLLVNIERHLRHARTTLRAREAGEDVVFRVVRHK
jgi:hypothetical protein